MKIAHTRNTCQGDAAQTVPGQAVTMHDLRTEACRRRVGNAERQRRSRERKRARKLSVRIDVHDRIGEALIAAGRLTELQVSDRPLIEREWSISMWTCQLRLRLRPARYPCSDSVCIQAHGELSGVQAFDKWPPALALGMLSPRRQHLKKADFAIHIPLASRPARVIAAVEAAANAVRRRLRASGAQRAAVIPSVRFIGLGTDRLADRGSWVFRLRSWRPDRARLSPPCFRQSACGRRADSP